MFGCVGEDSFGESMLNNLKEEGVRAEHVRKIPGVTSGLALITVAENDNMIVVVSGANGFVTVEYLETVKEEILEHDIILLQNEIPDETVDYAIEVCHKAGKTIIYNPAPAYLLKEELIQKVSYLTPNEHEAMIVIGDSTIGQPDCLDKLIINYPEKLIVTMGSCGVKAADAEGVFLIPSLKSDVVDTTGAGDTFNGAFAFALSQGKDFRETLHLANAAAGLSVEKEGAQAGMPNLEAVRDRLSR